MRKSDWAKWLIVIPAMLGIVLVTYVDRTTPPEKIQVVVQRQSIIHSMVQFSDNSILAQLGVPDMRIPIQYALTWPDRLPSPVPELDFAALKSLSFDVADEETFRCLAACKKAIRKGGLAPCAANEIGRAHV